MWRPDNWDEIKPKIWLAVESTRLDEQYVHGYQQGVEAGADAMLGALRAEGDRISAGWVEMEFDLDVNGHLVFIPDEEENSAGNNKQA